MGLNDEQAIIANLIFNFNIVYSRMFCKQYGFLSELESVTIYARVSVHVALYHTST